MKIGTKGHYSVIAMIELARQTTADKPVSLSRIAEKQNIPLNYLEQLFVQLKKARLVKGVRGAFGGYFLARPAEDISVWEVLTGSGELVRLNQCLFDKKQASFCMGRKSHCEVHNLWMQTTRQLRFLLEKVSLKKMLDKSLVKTPESLNYYDAYTTYSEEENCVLSCEASADAESRAHKNDPRKSNEKDAHLS